MVNLSFQKSLIFIWVLIYSCNLCGSDLQEPLLSQERLRAETKLESEQKRLENSKEILKDKLIVEDQRKQAEFLATMGRFTQFINRSLDNLAREDLSVVDVRYCTQSIVNFSNETMRLIGSRQQELNDLYKNTNKLKSSAVQVEELMQPVCCCIKPSAEMVKTVQKSLLTVMLTYAPVWYTQQENFINICKPKNLLENEYHSTAPALAIAVFNDGQSNK
jgi:hypothetical protein